MGTILLVEDEVMILDTTKELLELLKHRVLTASTGHETLRTLAELGDSIDIVLLDLSLPDMNARLLLPELAAKYPELKIVICSGALPDELDFHNQPIVKAILNKPFELSKLREIVGKLINDC